MKIGIGLPNPVPGTSGQLLLDWARRAEERGFSGLVTIDRVNYPAMTRWPFSARPLVRPAGSS